MNGSRLFGLALLITLATIAGVPATAGAADAPSAVSAGRSHTCAVLSPGGGVACWGAGDNGRLGDGTSAASATPVLVSALHGATSVSAASTHTCALLRTGSVSCWGFANRYSPLGESADVIPVAVRGLTGVVAVDAGEFHNCALLADGGVACWGETLGNESGDHGDTPIAVGGIAGATAVDAGAGFSCAVVTGGAVRCWGAGAEGQLGNGTRSSSAAPVAVSGIASAGAVSVGVSHACALLSGGSIACWGAGENGQLGNGTNTASAAPVTVSGISDAIAVSAGGTHTCALLRGGEVRCWGYGGDGELGTGDRSSSLTPVANGVQGATAISSGLSHTCALLSSGELRCWGAGDEGQLGDGRRTSSATPVSVVGLQVPPPVFARTTTLQTVSGTVRVRPPGAKDFTVLRAAVSLPFGTTVDTTDGRVRLTSAANAGGDTQSGLFYGGRFVTSHATAGSAGLTVITLTGALPTGCRASAAQKRKKSRRVWGEAKGSFRAAGRHASATVRGTKWLVEDSCAGTLVRVAEGSVRVEDLVTHRTVVVTANNSYQAGPGRKRQTARGFTSGVGRLLARLASGRTRLGAAIDGAIACTLSPKVAGRRVAGVIDNRTAIRDSLDGLGAPNARARAVVARLRSAVTHSIAADRLYRDWLNGLSDARCPLPRTRAFVAAGREDRLASRAKQRLVAAFNPLARQHRLRTWRANQI